jgi:hypothetical protein
MYKAKATGMQNLRQAAYMLLKGRLPQPDGTMGPAAQQLALRFVRLGTHRNP